MIRGGGHLIGAHLTGRYFRHQLIQLPPIDAFSTMELSKLADSIMEWKQFQKEEYDMYLEVRPKDHHDPDDEMGRVQAWRRQRLSVPRSWNWIFHD